MKSRGTLDMTQATFLPQTKEKLMNPDFKYYKCRVCG